MRGAMTGDSNRTVAIVVAAGRGERAGDGPPKQYRAIAGKAVAAYAVEAFARHPAIDAVLLVIGTGQDDLARTALATASIAPTLVTGGATRQASVRAGLDHVAATGGAGRVLIHDAARPFLPAAVIDRVLAGLDRAPGVIPVLPVVDTLARGDGLLGDPVDRDGLQRVQTPQGFDFQTILSAHVQQQGRGDATDDAQILKACGHDVILVEGDVALEKLTHPGDFTRAERALAASRLPRTGMGYDVHRLVEGEELWLGGVRIDHAFGLSGHSDADVALHALVDAILGALADGDIGSHFPPSDPQWRGAASCRFVEYARDRVAARGGVITHVDLTLICEAPRIGPHRQAMRARIAELLDIPLSRVSIKATTTERLGFAGRREGIAAQAVATILLPEPL